MTAIEDATVLLASNEPDKNRAFGTAFIIAHKQDSSYLLTCAHVIEQINGQDSTENHLKILNLDNTVEIVCCGSSNTIDIALLKAKGLQHKPIFDNVAKGAEDSAIQITGYSSFDTKTGQHSRRTLDGMLGKSIMLSSKIADSQYPAWDIHIDDNELEKLDNGYSGSPLYTEHAELIGVVSHRRSGDKGHAFCISNLKTLYPEITQLLPAFEHLNKRKSSQKTETGITRLTPFLVNRRTQEILLGQGIKQHQNLSHPFLCIVHGKDQEYSDMFVERIIHYTLPKTIPEQLERGVKVYQFSCDKFNSQQQLHANIQTGLSERIVGDMFSDLALISEVLAQEKRPIILCATLSSKDCENRQGIKNIEFFLSFWSKWVACKQQNHLILMCLCFDYRPVDSGFFSRLLTKNSLNKKIRDYFNHLDFAKYNLNGIVLPELGEIDQDQVEDWARLHLNPIYEKLKPRIRELFTEKQQTLAMEPLAIQLEKMLQEVTES